MHCVKEIYSVKENWYGLYNSHLNKKGEVYSDVCMWFPNPTILPETNILKIRKTSWQACPCNPELRGALRISTSTMFTLMRLDTYMWCNQCKYVFPSFFLPEMLMLVPPCSSFSLNTSHIWSREQNSKDPGYTCHIASTWSMQTSQVCCLSANLQLP